MNRQGESALDYTVRKSTNIVSPEANTFQNFFSNAETVRLVSFSQVISEPFWLINNVCLVTASLCSVVACLWLSACVKQQAGENGDARARRLQLACNSRRYLRAGQALGVFQRVLRAGSCGESSYGP